MRCSAKNAASAGAPGGEFALKVAGHGSVALVTKKEAAESNTDASGCKHAGGDGRAGIQEAVSRKHVAHAQLPGPGVVQRKRARRVHGLRRGRHPLGVGGPVRALARPGARARRRSR